MEMPEGFTQLKEMLNAEDTWVLQEDFVSSKVKKALLLMEEMAVVLQEIQEAGTEEVYLSEEGKHDIVMNGYAIDAKIALDKFKGWK